MQGGARRCLMTARQMQLRLVDGSILFWGHPTADELSYKESVWPPPTHSDFMYIRNGSLNTA